MSKQQVRDIELIWLITGEILLETPGSLKGFLPERCYIHRTIYLMKTRFIWIVCGGLLMAGPTFAQFLQPQPEWQSVGILQTVNPIFPYRLQQLAVGTGEARVAVNTDATGKLVEYLVVGYTMPEFADAAVTAIKQWKFEPARWRGEPVGTTIELIFSYEAKGVVVSTANLDEQMEALFLRLTEGRYVYRPCSLRELDRIPTPVVTITPQYSSKLAAKGVKGKVTIDFYIDETGTVRMPAVSIKDDSELTALAVVALRQWKFEPPTRNGRPVLVKATQVFNFGPNS
jgi:TonB family protein